jgi:glycosyltransferase involved in cell wall biosynthesis
MIPVSVVIIAKNESAVIDRCLKSIQFLTDDILVCDTGSTDNTRSIAQKRGARVIDMEWKGYGATKNAANQLAKYEWIFQLDADEMIDESLLRTLQQINWNDEQQAYMIRRKRYFMGKHMRFGAWGHEKKTRIFRRQNARWTHDAVHEKLHIVNTEITLIAGHILDKTFQNPEQFNAKLNRYAQLCAEKYFAQQRTGAWWKRYVSPLYTFMMDYILRLGFLDGKAGLILALKIANYTFNKYSHLYQLHKFHIISN